MTVDHLGELMTDYDSNADVMYVSMGKPVPAVTETDEDGLILRFALNDNRQCGVTVLSYNKAWGSERCQLAQRIADFLMISKDYVLQTLAHSDTTVST